MSTTNSATKTPIGSKAPAAKQTTTAAASNTADTAGPSAADKKFKDLETKTKAVNANNIARVANSQLTSAEEKLLPLLSLKTGKQLEKSPESSRAIEKLSSGTVDAMLNELQADRTGKECEKRERLRVQMGLKPNPA